MKFKHRKAIWSVAAILTVIAVGLCFAPAAELPESSNQTSAQTKGRAPAGADQLVENRVTANSSESTIGKSTVSGFVVEAESNLATGRLFRCICKAGGNERTAHICVDEKSADVRDRCDIECHSRRYEFSGSFERIIGLDGQQVECDPTTKVSSTTQGGIYTANFDTQYGRVSVSLPDDMRAGDTISGTVRVEPKGTSEAEVQKNRDSLNGAVLEWMMEPGDAKSPASGKVLGKVNISTSGASNFSLEIPGGEQSQKPIDRRLKTILTTGDGSQYLFKDQFVWGGYAYSTPGLHLPTMGQPGRPIEIQGPFDGRSENTNVSLGKEQVRLLVESPRKIVFESPMNLTGPAEIVVKEGNAETRGPYRNIRVQLTAPKTNLMRREETVLTVEVRGLEGITKDVPLQLESKGVITMEGGNFQNLRIKPNQVTPEGRYTTTRTITGVTPGGFNVSATVIVRPFDVCLWEDNHATERMLWNTFTGDYIFTCGGAGCPPAGTNKPGGTSTQTGGTQTGGTSAGPTGTAGILSGGYSSSLTGTGKLVMKGCIITLTHNAPDRRVFASLDACTKTGNASVETSSPNSPKVKFSIRDRGTDDTCDDQ